MITSKIKELLRTATSKALATNGASGVNVIPVSMIKVNESDIWLFDFFMNKTAVNLREQNVSALAAWTDTRGIQIKAETIYITEGTFFEEAVDWVRTQNPNRIVKGLIILKPITIYDVSLGVNFSEDDLLV